MKSLSATNLAVHHHLNCDLYLHNVYNYKNPTDSGPSELSKAQFKRGIQWETCLDGWLDNKDLLLRIPSFPISGEQLVNHIDFEEREHFFLAGFVFWAPNESFKSRFEGRVPVKFGLAKPDLVEMRRTKTGIVWRVIDAKASNAVKTSHHVQIYFYTLCLTYILPRPYFRPEGTAAIWLPPSDGFDVSPPSFSDLKAVNISLLAPSLDQFLFQRLPKLLSLPATEISWHYNPLCRGCPYSDDCSRRAVDENKIGSMSNISFEEARVLRTLITLEPSSGISDIEDLSTIISDPAKLQTIEKTYPLTVRKAKRILALSRDNLSPSPIVTAAKKGTIQVKAFRNFTCPRREDIAVVISLLQDPSTPGTGIASFSVSVFSSIIAGYSVNGIGTDLVPSLASIISKILAIPSMPTTQFYVFSPSEQSVLERHLVDVALTSETNEDIRLCIGALSQGASLLQTTIQPILLSGALLGFLSKPNRTKGELIECLQRMNLPSDGSIAELRNRIDDSLRQYQAASATNSSRRRELGQLDRIVVLKREIGNLLALPIPGFWDLPECAQMLTNIRDCPSDESIYQEFVNGEVSATYSMLERRNTVIRRVLQRTRMRLALSMTEILVNDAQALSANFMDICKEDHLRKLFFMQQFEVLAKMKELWKSRIDGCPDAPILEYQATAQGSKGIEHIFSLISGSLDIPVQESDRSFYDQILVEDVTDNDELPVEALFDDLGVSGLVFPLNKHTKVKWEEQHPIVQGQLLLAELRDVSMTGRRTVTVSAQTWGGSSVQFVPGKRFRVSPRFVDFNITKVLATLVEYDFQCIEEASVDGIAQISHGGSIPSLQLIVDPESITREHDYEAEQQDKKISKRIQRLFHVLRELSVESASMLVLKPSQSRASQRILSNRLSVVWGPPGTGKTHTIALSLLRVLEIQYETNPNDRRIVFVAAVTHAAIEAFLKKLKILIACYRDIDALPADWLDVVQVEHVVRGNNFPAPPSSSTIVYVGTVFQLYNLSKKHRFKVDCVVIDEAGQLSLSTASLVFRSLHPRSKIIITGDSEQLAPILSAQYPELKNSQMFGSILDCLMFWSKPPTLGFNEGPRPASPEIPDTSELSSQGTVVQLTENFRLNPDLGDFVSTIYSRAFKSQTTQARKLAYSLKMLGEDISEDLGNVPAIMESTRWTLLALSSVMLRQPQNILDPPSITVDNKFSTTSTHSISAPRPISLLLVRLKTYSTRATLENLGYEDHVKAEAMLAVALVSCLQHCDPSEDIFVAAPHRIQRQTVRSTLEYVNRNRSLSNAMDQLHLSQNRTQEQPFAETRSGKITIDTPERLQGSEAAYVICLFSMPKSSPAELGFILERRRLNVAISRAKTLCIMISSSEVLRPSVNILANEEYAKGYAFLRAFEERAWSTDIPVDVDNI